MTAVNEPCIRVHAVEVAEKFGGGCSRHLGSKHRIAQTVLNNVILERTEVVTTAESGVLPHVVLQYAFRGARSGVERIVSHPSGKICAGLIDSVIDGLEYLAVESPSLWRVEWQTGLHEDIGQPLCADGDRTCTCYGRLRGRGRVYSFVQERVCADKRHTSCIVKCIKIVRSIRPNKPRHRDGGQGANSGLLAGRILKNFRAQVGCTDDSKMGMVALV